MPKLSAVIADQATVEVELGGEPVIVTYRPRRMTPELQERIAAAEGAAGIRTALYGPIAELLVSWDLTQDDGTPIDPSDEEALRTVPSQVLLAVLRGVLQDARPNPSKAPASANGSSQTASWEPRPIGTAS